ncbi:pirin family protein [Microbacterium sp. CFBP9034]|uniref:pirin family protein n=1 Tax=Microbacterium sp. CFBP9034 TaxID=3096540 RepID=UPI002A69CDAE|nr:pirin family protein [Microbacterium sp. CFBP9034]MDY0907964.1 pirin family protein [Microbacterium sp. CFBP9034]
MTRLDTDAAVATEASASCDGPRSLLLEARDVPLGGVRAMEVRRALPQRDLPLVGAWCFLDRFGPQVTRMRVEPHPHIGLQTVTWPFVGDVRHRDSVGSDVTVRRGALNLMTSGAGIAHSEYSIGEDAAPLDALQLWVALPEGRRHGPPAFEQHAVLPEIELTAVEGSPGSATVVLGEFAGTASPATTYTPIVGAEIRVPAGSRVRLPLDPAWEHALIGVEGDVAVHAGPDPDSGVGVDGRHLLYLGIHREAIEVSSTAGATLFLLGGEPFEDDIVMWWNFVGRTHEEIVDAREAWEAGGERFGRVVDHGDERIPAPPLPAVRLTQRRRRV